MMMEQKYGPLLALNKRLNASKEEHAEFVRIEAVGVDDQSGIGNAGLSRWRSTKYMAPATRNSRRKQQYALAILKGRQKGKQYEWWVDDVRFPYTPKSYVAPVAVPGRRSRPRTLTVTARGPIS